MAVTVLGGLIYSRLSCRYLVLLRDRFSVTVADLFDIFLIPVSTCHILLSLLNFGFCFPPCFPCFSAVFLWSNQSTVDEETFRLISCTDLFFLSLANGSWGNTWKTLNFLFYFGLFWTTFSGALSRLTSGNRMIPDYSFQMHQSISIFNCSTHDRHIMQHFVSTTLPNLTKDIIFI